ncbi:uncharacterized protein LOC128670806 isoform X2 [Plodia interpunctella]|uniref:uncharacterized protein LOC128670806 isoform X2 n=1 Tax=Plodia interpunctella TaxID=58824 RepID=UPI0023682C95|nr:uncharacterized protein LOC128670806 isoform X2 [Plodia interpunctella]
MTPRKKKAKLVGTSTNLAKRVIEAKGSEPSRKRIKAETSLEEDIQAMKKKNFITACERVSYKAYFDKRSRFQLIYLPACANGTTCVHQEYKNGTLIKPMSSYAEQSFKIEIKTNMWCEALEVGYLSITTNQYLSASILKDIIEIMLNAHEDSYADYTIGFLMDKCQTLLSQNFSMHPPCLVKSLRKCYNEFLTSPLDMKENTFTNRSNFEYDKGIVKYCMNRLEHEISGDSEDGPLIDKCEHIPEDMKQTVRGLHWQKEKFEIYELLERNERIERLMYVLESIIELLQYDLAIWLSRYTRNLGCHVMRSHKPLMAYILWSNNVLYTGAVNNNCRQILQLFVNIVHLQYPTKYLRIMVNWLNTIIQTFYFCETNSTSDYPHTGKYCMTFAKEFYKIISGLPPVSVIRILELIQPSYMQHLIATLHIKTLLSTNEDDIIRILINFVTKKQWTLFPESDKEITISKKIISTPKKFNNITSYLVKKCKNLNISESECPDILYPKLETPLDVISDTYVNHVVHALYVSLEAYLDSYNVQNVQDTLDNLNKKLAQKSEDSEDIIVPDYCSYTVSESFIKKYTSLYKTLRELILIMNDLKNKGLTKWSSNVK